MPRTFEVGQVVTYYPRRGKPGRPVKIIAIRDHPFHGWTVRFRYQDGRVPGRGRERELTYAAFITEPD
jgi:hypothetical protein